jgi:hypothetical protein
MWHHFPLHMLPINCEPYTPLQPARSVTEEDICEGRICCWTAQKWPIWNSWPLATRCPLTQNVLNVGPSLDVSHGHATSPHLHWVQHRLTCSVYQKLPFHRREQQFLPHLLPQLVLPILQHTCFVCLRTNVVFHRSHRQPCIVDNALPTWLTRSSAEQDIMLPCEISVSVTPLHKPT